MKVKTVKAVISKKFADWVSSIKDEELQALVRRNSFVTGGCIVSLLLNEPVSDYDIYFTDFETCKRVAEYYVEEFRLKTGKDNQSFGKDNQSLKVNVDGDRISVFVSSQGIAEVEEDFGVESYVDGDPVIDEVLEQENLVNEKAEAEKQKYQPVFVTDNSITLSGKIQLIIRFHGDPATVHKNFDFVHCTGYWESRTRTLTLPAPALKAILGRELIYVGSLYPICSLLRCRKFIKRGWSVNAGQILKMVFQIKDLDINDIKVLREQLVGVDSAYFMALLDQLSLSPSCNQDRLDTLYLTEVIDRVFG